MNECFLLASLVIRLAESLGANKEKKKVSNEQLVGAFREVMVDGCFLLTRRISVQNDEGSIGCF
jgi:hypothetical protein